MTLAATAAAVAAARATATTVSAVAATAATAAPTATETEAAADVGSLNVCSTAVITIVWILAIHKSVLAIHKIVLHKSVFRTLDVVRMSDCTKVYSEPWTLLECLTAACKALSLANGKGKGTNGLVIGSLD